MPSPLTGNRHSKRALISRLGHTRDFSTIEKEYQGSSAQAGVLSTRIKAGERSLSKLERKVTRLNGRLRGGFLARAFRYFIIFLMRGRKAARLAYQTPAPRPKLEEHYLNLSISAGDLAFRVNKDKEELKKLFGSMGALTKEGERERIREEAAAEERARKAHAKAEAEKAKLEEAKPPAPAMPEGVPA